MLEESVLTFDKNTYSYIDKYKPKYSIKLSTKDFSYDPKTKIKTVPLYATFLIKTLVD